MNHYATRVSILLISAACFAQQPPEFAVASIRPSRPANFKSEASEKISISPARLILSYCSLRSLIRWAYDLRDNQISGPGWMDEQRFDISANADGATDLSGLKAMMRILVAGRFKIESHRETKELPVYTLVVGKKGARLKPGAPDGEPMMRPFGGALEFRNYTMAAFAERFGGRPLRLDRPVYDRTGLAGVYDFNLTFADNPMDMKKTLEDMDRSGLEQNPFIFTLLDEQLGLSLKGTKAPIEILIIDHIEHVPVEN